ncbi:alpha/beta hydrolase [Actinoplanes sp. OR16]|uniref:alpha/beta fold hydrolase n=1 Tax=Actinoplanes sp. OR16 TaxID=946334 RepID=UPI000F6F29DF|nr:alpha/beta hydrolase [Actinoplanes sp. OR16]BBH68067.1 alpha/beta hydrolase [Actinoplanes sp. OR16]
MKISKVAASAFTVAFGAAALLGGVHAAGAHPRAEAKPTVVLVHGAFADSSGWNAVVQRLRRDGYPVVSAANPLRGVASDAASVRALVDSVSGPVVLVGHSYGGSVISQAATHDPDVKALVFIAAFAPETGETAAGLSGKFPGSTLGATLKEVPLPGGHTDLYIDPKLFPQQFAADVPAAEAKLYAIAQRPIDQAALTEPSSGPQAWHSIPSFTLISGADKNIPPAAQRFMAQRAHATVETVKGASHMVFVSHPAVTADFIERAARTTR